MRAAFIFLVLLLLIGMAVPVLFATQFWNDGSSVIARAQMSGALRPPDAGGRLSTAEQTIAMDQFPGTWRARGTPCRTLSNLWNDISSPDWSDPGTPVSQRFATVLQASRPGGAVRRHVRRFIVACQLEQRFDDTQILRMWLSTANFGPDAVGLETAAQAIFQKPSRELNAEESARLAALLRAPGLRSQPERWTQRAQAIQERIAPRMQ